MPDSLLTDEKLHLNFPVCQGASDGVKLKGSYRRCNGARGGARREERTKNTNKGGNSKVNRKVIRGKMITGVTWKEHKWEMDLFISANGLFGSPE